MTESCAMAAILPPDFYQTGSVGIPVPSTEIKLVDVPEMNYFSSNTTPQGEVWLRGPSITTGYYKRDAVTAETITSDNWLKTGDIGEWVRGFYSSSILNSSLILITRLQMELYELSIDSRT